MAKTQQLSRWATAGACLALLSISCTTVMYNGPRRPSEKVAKLSSGSGSSPVYCGTKIVKVDDKDVKDGTFELLPGLHKVKVDSDCWKAPPAGAAAAFGLVGSAFALGATLAASAKHSAERKEDLTVVCWKAKPGREYTVRTLTESGVWQIELIDEETSDNVKDFCD